MGHRMNGNGKYSIRVVRCQGNLNASKMVQVKNRLSRLLQQNCKWVLLDLSRARRIDLAGLGILIDRVRKLRASNGDVRLFNLRPRVLETLRNVGAQELETFSTEQEARRSFQFA